VFLHPNPVCAPHTRVIQPANSSRRGSPRTRSFRQAPPVTAFLGAFLIALLVIVGSGATAAAAPSVAAPVLTPQVAPSGTPVGVTVNTSDPVAVSSAEMSVDGGPWTGMTAETPGLGHPNVTWKSSVGAPPVQFSSAPFGACATLSDGTGRCWGYNWQMELGDGTGLLRNAPVPVAGLSTAKEMSASAGYTCALLVDTTVRCWGFGLVGQLGHGEFNSSPVPVQVTGLSGATAISTAHRHSCALLGDTTVRCWGDIGFSDPAGPPMSASPVPVPGLSGVTAIATGTHHNCALLSDGTVRCWGLNQYGQFGLGHDAQIYMHTPGEVPGLSGVTAITAGGLHTCALLADTTVRCWGQNNEGEIGNGTFLNNVVVPAPVLRFPFDQQGLKGVTAISAGDGIGGPTHTCALLADTSAVCWGYNANGQLGNRVDANSGISFDPFPVSVQGGLTGIVEISPGGGSFTCARFADTTVRCWGFGFYGQLGDGIAHAGPSFGSLTPVKVAGLGSLGAGSHTVCARASNNSGEISDGTACAALDVGPAAGGGVPPQTSPSSGSTTGPVPPPRPAVRRITVTRSGVVVAIGCPPGARACTGTITLTIPRGRRRGQAQHLTPRLSPRIELGNARFSIPAGAQKAIAVRLNARGRILLARSKKLAATVTVTATSGPGATLVVRRGLVLRQGSAGR
jgi:alpha-tubulin suppressor-like RCC1 family protein